MSTLDAVVFGALIILAVVLVVICGEVRAADAACQARGGVYVDGYCLDARRLE